MLPKVSVIVPIFNKEKYLRNCLDILLSQSLQDIEIICVDDFSVDSSREILYEYAMKDNRIICVFHEENKSTSQTRKDGVLVSTGQYIMFVDGDDELYPDSCEKAYNAIEKYQTDIVHFNTTINNCAKVPQARIDMNKKLVQPFLGNLVTEDLIISCWKDRKFGFQIWNKIYNGQIVRKAFSEVEDGSFPKAQDLYAFFLIAFYSKTYYGIEDELYKYNFGLGVTGRDFIPLSNFRTLLTEKRVHEALTRFLEGKHEKEKYSEVLQGIYNGFLNECVVRWRDNLYDSAKSEGFELLTEVFGLEDVLCFLARTDWDPEVRIGELMKDVAFFRYKKRDKKKKTIAAYYRCIANGGAQHVVAMLCNRWAEMKDESGDYLYDVVLVTDVEPVADEYGLSKKVKRAFVPPFASSVKEHFRERYKAWVNIIQDFNIDIVVSSLWVDPVIYWDMLAIKGQKSKPAFIIHTQSFCAVPFEFQGNNATTQIYKYMICDGVVTLSECDKLFVSSFNNHVRYIDNPIAFKPQELPLSTYDENTLVWVGRISYEKQPLDAIKMMKFVVEKIPDAKLLLVGDGNETLNKQIRELIQQYELEANIDVIGFTLDVGAYYKRSSAMICTSKYEGFCLTIAEALAFGLPVISYDMPWLTFMQDGRGIITVPQKKYEILAQTVVELLSNKERIKELGKQGKQLITEIANENIEIEWEDFFENIPIAKEKDNEQDFARILFKYLTLYQYDGKIKAVNAEIQKVKRVDNELKKAKATLQNAQNKNKTLETNLKKETEENKKGKALLDKIKREKDFFAKELTNVKSGYSFRIGRIITWLPRKLTGRK
ncbi:glycosyltransferase [Succiniclasticum ruminis]|uniref:Glycosyltransferase involved in cell wall bisynthesis n=1 Tax=Succiniclasticum ruminis DSM 9236 TaxID=1123323 RepID=A0A1I2AAC1_9FIRM|nr:glycosyltransferase [Succiniclasticum ruminis]SFE41005.1 Glycosyltransferase involved in cell wall bisynthesis [Succiniclasticum ruminis DSM 9236]